METNSQDPAASGAAAAVAAPEPESRSSQNPDPGRSAGESENLTGAALKADLARARRARRERSSASGAPTTGQPTNTTPPASDPAETPPAAEGTGTDNSLATSAPTSGDAVLQGLASGEPEPGQPETPLDPEALEDPEAIAELTEEQVRKIKDASIRKMVRRIQRLTARTKSAETALAEYKASQAPARETRPNEATNGEAFPGHPTLQPLNDKIGRIERAMAWAELNPDGGTYRDPVDGTQAEFTPDMVANILRNAPRQLTRLEAERTVKLEGLRQQDHQARQAATQQAYAAFPWMKDPASDEYAMAAGILQNAPYLQQHPEWPLWLGDAIEGRKAREARAKATTAPPRPVPPRIPAPGGVAAPRANPVERALAEAEAAYEKSGRAGDLKRVMTLQRQLQRSGARG